MAVITLQGDIEKKKGIFYQFDTDVAPIGEGGMGRVCQGLCVNERTRATRPVAIKCMFDDLPQSAYDRARREASIQLRNDNLVEMLGFIVTEEPSAGGSVIKHYHVISELLTGVSLSDVLEGKTADRNGNDVPFAVKMLQDYRNDPEHFAQTITISVLSGLMALHDAGYIHRDIDPSNIMLTAEGHIKLIDFGIAKQMNNLTTGDKSLTVAGKFMGKPEYAAPELVLGDISHQNQTTDIYAVGILLYQCIVGHTPFEGPRHEVLEKQLKAKMPLQKIKNRHLRRIIATACEKKQELRYQSSAQMRVALENENGMKQAMSSKKKITIGAIAAVVVVLLISTVFIVKSKQDKARQAAELARTEQKAQKVRSDVTAKMNSAYSLYKAAMTKEEENYEKQLMSAFDSYTAAEKMAAGNTSLKAVAGDIAKKKADVLNALDSAKADFEENAASLAAMGETDMAESYKARAKAIGDFIVKNKK